MARILTSAMLGVALIAAAGCTKKPPNTVIPPDTTNNGPAYDNSGSQQEGVSTLNAQFQRETLGDTVHFAFDQYDIDPEARRILDSQAQWLRAHPNTRITIEGHCDERGTREYNLALGDRRANAAKNYLASAGISPSRINTVSFGKERPIALGSDDQSWAANRRAVTVVVN